MISGHKFKNNEVFPYGKNIFEKTPGIRLRSGIRSILLPDPASTPYVLWHGRHELCNEDNLFRLWMRR